MLHQIIELAQGELFLAQQEVRSGDPRFLHGLDNGLGHIPHIDPGQRGIGQDGGRHAPVDQVGEVLAAAFGVAGA